MLNTTNQLTEQQLKDLEGLKASCKNLDGSIPNVYTYLLAQRRALPAIILCYEQQKLIGFLGVYFFYDDAVEVALLVEPSARRQGIAKQLIDSILPLVQAQKYNRLIFSTPANINHHWLPTLGFTYLHSEYSMKRDDLTPLFEYKKLLSFRMAKESDIPILCQLDEACFLKKHNESSERFQHLIDDRNYQIFIALQNKRVIGKAHLRCESNEAILSDIAILPALQGKGLGTALIAHCINTALSEGKHHLSLDVETHNQRALNLYIRLGFTIHNACDYWTITLQGASVGNGNNCK